MDFLKFPISKTYKKFECFFRVYDPDYEGNINITLRLNTVNDNKTYRWVYSNVQRLNGTSREEFFKPLVDLDDELHHLRYTREGQEPQFANGKYIKCGVLYAIPIFDGNESFKQIADEEPFPAIGYIKTLNQ